MVVSELGPFVVVGGGALLTRGGSAGRAVLLGLGHHSATAGVLVEGSLSGIVDHRASVAGASDNSVRRGGGESYYGVAGYVAVTASSRSTVNTQMSVMPHAAAPPPHRTAMSLNGGAPERTMSTWIRTLVPTGSTVAQ